jgi:DNA-binding XRE family transcriptional regulator
MEFLMPVTKWNDLDHGISSEERERLKRDALAEYDRKGYAALRKARELTQVELAAKLGVTQATVAAMEGRTDTQIGTLAKYIRAMGGDLQLLAVFPEATFHLDLVPSAAPRPTKAAKSAGKRRA